MNWRLKLKSLLHDPPHKQWVMFSNEGRKISVDKALHGDHQWHEKVAEHLLNYLLYDECIKDNNIESADQVASALSRIIIAPKLKENLKDEFEKQASVNWEEIKFIDIFSLKEFELFQPEHEKVAELFKNLGNLSIQNEEKRAKFFFYFLWRFYLEIIPWLNSHPADSRAPNHSIYDHLVQTSAVVNSLPKPAFLLFTIGPVQKFIAIARKTQDLWAGSYILSYLTWKAIEVIVEELGPDHIIFSNLLRQPLMDKWLYEKILKDIDFSGAGLQINGIDPKAKLCDNFVDEKITIANMPNRFLAIVPYEKNGKRRFNAEELAKKCEDKFKSFLENLALKVLNKLMISFEQDALINIKEKLENPKDEREKKELEETKKNIEKILNDNVIQDEVKKQISKHLLSYFQIYWVILPWTNSNINDLNPIFNDYKEIFGIKEEKDEEGIYKTVKLITEMPYYKHANIGSAYSLLLELTEKLLGARKSVRDFNPIAEEGDKCTLCGEFNQLWFLGNKPNWKDKGKYDANKKLRNANENLWKSLIPLVGESEYLCSICLTKRLFPEIIKKELNLQNDIKFPSTSEMASIGEKRRLKEEIKEEFIKKFEEFRAKVKQKNNGREFPETISVAKLKNDPLYKIDGQFLMENTYRVDYFEKEYGLKVDEKDFEDIVKILKENKINPSAYYAILQMDGDNMGKWLKGEFNPQIGEVIHRKTKDALIKYAEGEDLEKIKEILCSPHPTSPSIHQAFSRKLSEFALNNVREIVEDSHYGKLIYAGGDDVLAFLPIEEVLDCAYDLQKKFKEVLSPKASMSAGILIAHHKYPLYLALKEVQDAEKRAKNYFQKDAFCIRVLTHSGEIRETGGKWDLISFMKELICKFKNDEISSRFPYQFLETVEKLVEREGEKQSKINPSDKVYEIIKSEIKRIYERKEKSKEAERFIEEIFKIYERYEFSYFDFANIFIIARFIGGEARI